MFNIALQKMAYDFMDGDPSYSDGTRRRLLSDPESARYLADYDGQNMRPISAVAAMARVAARSAKLPSLNGGTIQEKMASTGPAGYQMSPMDKLRALLARGREDKDENKVMTRAELMGLLKANMRGVKQL